MTTTKKILVVDDDIDVITIVETILANENFEVITANGKDEALAKAEAEKPDMAICDVMMSTHYEGFELAEQLTQNEKYGKIPVLMQTSIKVFASKDPDTMKFARNYRSEMNSDDLDVLLVEYPETGKAGIDYKNENGEIIWLPVDGFIPKPVTAQKLLEAVKRVLA